MKQSYWTSLRSYSRIILAVFSFVLFSALAFSVHADINLTASQAYYTEYEQTQHDQTQQDQTQAIQKAFDIMQSVGNASNGGAGKEEALRQVCALFQEKSTKLLYGALDERFRNPSLLSDSALGSLVYTQGQTALARSLSSSCAALTGQGGDIGSGLSSEGLQDMALSLAFDKGVSGD
jgi:hypothetical protein